MRNLDLNKGLFSGDEDSTIWDTGDSANAAPGESKSTPASDTPSGPATATQTDFAVGGSSQTGTAVATGASLPVVPPSPSAFTIAVNWDASVSSAPAGFTSDI
ncbi:MAG TPA: hypothetical protein VLI90_06985, partial [Tepidisphaeraceae bacterium]|nr:hypothetical protein [Tepidisphaeraceae bacterium]